MAPPRLVSAEGRAALFLFSGEGAHSASTSIAQLKVSPSWHAVQAAVASAGLASDLEEFLRCHLGSHTAPYSPVVTTAVNILNAERWRAAGFQLTFALGHSVGEVAAAWALGKTTVEEAIRTALVLGRLGAECEGEMLHTQLTHEELNHWTDPELCVAAINGVAPFSSDEAKLSVSLCGPSQRIASWLATDKSAKKLPSRHPWHHPSYRDATSIKDGSAFAALPSCPPGADYWLSWLTSPVDFHSQLKDLAPSLAQYDRCFSIEMGAHPVLTPVTQKTLQVNRVDLVAAIESMRRGQPDGFWEAQRSRLLSLLLQPKSTQPQARGRSLEEPVVVARIQALLDSSSSIKHVGVDEPLMSAGLDSTDIQGFVDGLNVSFNVKLSPVTVLECSTVRAIASRLMEYEGPHAPVGKRETSEVAVSLASSVGRWPGGRSALELFQLVTLGGDAINEVELFRWSPPKNSPSSVNYAGVLGAADLFDNRIFGVSIGEARAMDPQQRLLLEEAYLATHSANMRRADLHNSGMGIYVGIMNADYARLTDSASVYAATGTQISMASGRLSFVLGVQGPCASVDTACSSALVAVNSAILSLSARVCDAALAAAANMILMPQVSLLFAKAGMLSSDGACKSFDARANGYVRSEGVSAAVLSMRGQAEQLLIRSCIVRSDGRSASLTAPNGSAQARMIHAALVAAGSESHSVVEAHGTGTALGDPTEVGALQNAWRGGKDSACCIASIKANLGHSEPTAGLVGMLSLIVELRQKSCAVNAHLCRLNPLLAPLLGRLPTHFPTQAVRETRCPIGGVSSFGYSGTIAHLVMSLEMSDALPVMSVGFLRYKRRAFPWLSRELPSKSKTLSMGSSACNEAMYPAYCVEWPEIATGLSESRAFQALVLALDPFLVAVSDADAQEQVTEIRSIHRSTTLAGPWSTIIIYTVACSSRAQCLDELNLLHIVRELMSLHAQCPTPAPSLWICTNSLQADRHPKSSMGDFHVGLWGLGRGYRQEMPRVLVRCIDSSSMKLSDIMRLQTIENENGVVEGLRTSSCSETELIFRSGRMKRPRLVTVVMSEKTYKSTPLTFQNLRSVLDGHVVDALRHLPVSELTEQYARLEARCLWFARTAFQTTNASAVPKWHHKLLMDWIARRDFVNSSVENEEYPRSAQCSLIDAEEKLAERCGPKLADVLKGAAAYQELLFPGGSMEMVLPVYETSILSRFYNECTVCAVQTIIQHLPKGHHISVLEIGAGTGGTASSLLPVLDGLCTLYSFTDVSMTFLRQASKRFAEYNHFVEYRLLNIDADPRLQGVAASSYDIVVGTNVLHATPFMRNTLRNCSLLLKPGGVLIVNDLVETSAFHQITFGMTDGWWLFADVDDPARSARDSPLLTPDEWKLLLDETGFSATHCMQGSACFRNQAVIVAQSSSQRRALQGAKKHQQTVGTCLISGGLGGLGLLTARILRQKHQRQKVLLTSRSGRVQRGSESDWQALISNGKECVLCPRCDVSQFDQVLGLLQNVVGEISSVMHLASSDPPRALMHKHDQDICRRIFSPKVHGCQMLHSGTLCNSLETFLVFSSYSAVLGGRAVASYVAANCWLESFFAPRRLRLGLHGQSVAWGEVGSVGIAARSPGVNRVDGILVMSRSVVLGALSLILSRPSLNVNVMLVDWRELKQGLPREESIVAAFRMSAQRISPALTQQDNQATGDSISGNSLQVRLSSMPSKERASLLAGLVLDLIHEIGNSAEAHADTPLMEAGIDSLAATELSSRLRVLTGLTISPTIAFEYPTPAGIVKHLMEQFEDTSVSASAMAFSRQVFHSSEGLVSILSQTGNWPGGCSTKAICWELQRACGDALGAVPLSRFDMTEIARSEALPVNVVSCIQHGGFIVGAQLFDAKAFGISRAEAEAMDPQQRLLLEYGYSALHSASQRRASLAGGDTAVCLGIERPDWGLALPASLRGSVYSLASDNVSVAAGRVSFALGLQGFCSAMDAACASALVALHVGTLVALRGECGLALVSAVTLKLAAHHSISLAKAHMLSVHGRCMTLDKRANGFARSEGVGALVLQANSGRAALTGSTLVRQDGRSASLTAPNGSAQRELIELAVARAGFTKEDVATLELHGTGTALGDPTEIGAITASHGSSTRRAPLLLGAAKANFGHCEPSSGLVGLLRARQILFHPLTAGNAMLRCLNPLIQTQLELKPSCCVLPTQGGANQGGVCGVNSFGFSGVIAHVVVSFEESEHSPLLSITPLIALKYKRRAFNWRASPAAKTTEHAKASLTNTHGTLNLTLVAPQKHQEHVEALVTRIVQELADVPATVETPFMDAGIDSIAAAELTLRLSKLLSVELVPTILFEHPSPRALATHLVGLTTGRVPTPPVAISSVCDAIIVIRSIHGRWPGGCRGKRDTMWLQHACGDAISSIPAARWEVSEVETAGAQSAVQASCVQHGGFLANVELFDGRFFSISPAEINSMDPQQRLLLEDGYTALHHASHRRSTLMGSDVGVSLAMEHPDWSLVQPPSARSSVYSVTGDNVSVASGRLSFVLGLQGPCSTVDTACSAALVALQLAARALREGDCSRGALAISVSLKLSPFLTLVAASAGMLSVDGRCKTFDTRANGYVRAENAGACVLQAGKEGEIELASAVVRQDGRSASLTAPNGTAQRNLLLVSLARGRATLAGVACYEAHGTGTSLGDPIEAGAISSVLGSSEVDKAVMLGAVKASVGHAEAAAAQSSLLRATRVLMGTSAAGNAMLRQLNPVVIARLANAAPRIAIPLQSTALAKGMNECGVSSFGYSGTIAHAVLRRSLLLPVPGSRQPPCVYERQSFPWLSLPLRHRELGVALVQPDSNLLWQWLLTDTDVSFLANHQVGKVSVAPGLMYVHVARAVMNACTGSGAFTMEKTKFGGFLFLDDSNVSTTLWVLFNRTTEELEISSSQDSPMRLTHFTSRSVSSTATNRTRLDVVAIQRRCSRVVEGSEFYKDLGNNYLSEFRAAQRCWARAGEVLARVEVRCESAPPILHGSAWSDAAIHSGLLAEQTDMHAEHCLPAQFFRMPYYGLGMGTVEYSAPSSVGTRIMWSHHFDCDGIRVMQVYNSSGRPIMRCSGFAFGTFDPGWLENRRKQLLASRRKMHSMMEDSSEVLSAYQDGEVPGQLVSLQVDDRGAAILELNDPQRFNTMVLQFGRDIALATRYLAGLNHITSVALQAKGPVFCAGGNPYASSGVTSMSFAESIYQSANGFACLRSLAVPITCAVHGAMIGGAAAIFLQADYRIADEKSTFQHGNLSRGVCPIAGYSRKLPSTIGSSSANSFYFTDAKISAKTALSLGLIQAVQLGVQETKSYAQMMARRLAMQTRVTEALIATRSDIDPQLLTREARGHCECLLANKGVILSGQAITADPTRVAQLLSRAASRSEAPLELLSAREEKRISLLIDKNLASAEQAAAEEERLRHCWARMGSPLLASCACLLPRRGTLEQGGPLAFEFGLGAPLLGESRVAVSSSLLSQAEEAGLTWLDFRFDEQLGVALLHLSAAFTPRQIMRRLAALVSRLSALRARAAVLCIEGACKFFRPLASERAAEEIKSSIAALHHLCVPIVCSAEGAVGGLMRNLWLASDYRIAGRGFSFASRQQPEAEGGQMQRLGLVNEAIESNAQLRALQFASWLAQHPSAGLTQMLRLTRARREEPSPTESTALAGLRLQLCYSSGREDKLALFRLNANVLQRHVLCVRPTIRSDQPSPLSAIQSLRPITNPRVATRERASFKPRASVLAISLHVPAHGISAYQLESSMGVPGKHTRGLLIERYSSCGVNEDTVSMGLTAIRQLFLQCNVQSSEVGHVQAISHSLLDRSKSLKSVVMSQFEMEGVVDVEGVDMSGSKGTEALLSCMRWMEGSSWDGRWAVALCSDGERGSPALGAAAAAVLVGLSGSGHSSSQSSSLLEAANHTGARSVWDTQQFLSLSPLHSIETAIASYKPISRMQALSNFERRVAPSLTITSLIGTLRTVASCHVTAWCMSQHSVRFFCSASPSQLRAQTGHDSSSFATASSHRFGRATTSSDMRRSGVFYLQEIACPTPNGTPGRYYCLAHSQDAKYAPRLPLNESPPPLAKPDDETSGSFSPELMTILSNLIAPLGAATSTANSAQEEIAVDVSSSVREVADELLPGVSADAPLMEAGLDSLGAVEFGSRLTARLGESVELPSTLVFDHPTLRQIETHLMASFKSAAPLAGDSIPGAMPQNALPGDMMASLTRLISSIGPLGAATSTTTSVQEEIAVDVSSSVREVADELLPGVSADAPLMEAGLDSLGAVEFGSRLTARLGESVELPSTLVFDHPTLRQIEMHLTASCKSAAAPVVSLPRFLAMNQPPDQVTSDFTRSAPTVRILGLETLKPGLRFDGARSMVDKCLDLVQEVPTTRWDALNGFEEPVASRLRYGAFIPEADLFDNHVFNISSTEAMLIDPQHRSLLEVSLALLHGTGQTKSSLSGTDTSVAVGIHQTEFAQLLAATPHRHSPFVSTAILSVASGRLSYTYGLHGPCTTLETGCSASLVACYMVASTIRASESKLGFAAGVNMLLSSSTHLSTAVAGMTSARGRCHTFDSRADGYSRGEACGTALLCADKDSLPDHADCFSIASVVVNSDGRSASLTAPNGSAQRMMISSAIAKASCRADDICIYEAHGTGTQLGDPIEAASLADAFRRKTGECVRMLCVSSIKATAAHSETAAAICGMHKLLTAMSMKVAAPNAQLRIRNPNVKSAMEKTSFVMLPTQLVSAKDNPCPSMGSISSFAYSGTISHALLKQDSTRQGLRVGSTRLQTARRSFPWRAILAEEVSVSPPKHTGEVSLSELGKTAAHLDVAQLEALVIRSVSGLVDKTVNIEADTPLTDLIDSLGATELAMELRHLTGVSLGASLVFTYSTASAIAVHISDLIATHSSPLASKPSSQETLKPHLSELEHVILTIKAEAMEWFAYVLAQNTPLQPSSLPRRCVGILGSDADRQATLALLSEVGVDFEETSNSCVLSGDAAVRSSLASKVEHCSCPALLHPSVITSPEASLDDGSLVSWGVLIGPRASIGKHCVIGAASVISHDVIIGDFSIIGVAVSFGGGCNVGAGCVIESYTTVKPYVTIGAGAHVSCGSSVIRNVPANIAVGGVPAMPSDETSDFTDVMQGKALSQMYAGLSSLRQSRWAATCSVISPVCLADERNRPSIAVIGAGAYARCLIEIILETGSQIEGIYDDSQDKHGLQLLNYEVKGNISSIPPGVDCVFAIGQNEARRAIYAKNPSYIWPAVIHPTTILAEDASIGEGCTFERYVIVGRGAKVGKFTFVGSRTVLGDNSIVEDYSFIGAGSIIGDRAIVRACGAIGLSCTILPDVEVGAGSTVGVGSIVCCNTPAGVSLLGTPAQTLGKIGKTRLG